MRVDVTVIGTGMSSLLLAEQLLRWPGCRRLTLVGPERELAAHVISYWSDVPTPFDAFAVAAFPAVRVVAAGRDLTRPLVRLRYRTVRARAWARRTLGAVLMDPRVERVVATAKAVEDDLTRPRVYAGGRWRVSDWVFTAAPPRRAPPDAWQRFEGWLVEAPAHGLDARAATLLDFRTDAGGELRFVYALPLGPSLLFVEHVSHRPSDHGAALSAYLGGVLGLRGFRVIEREAGSTPLYRDGVPRPEGRVVPIGVAAGRAKAATGYAATRLWRDAQQIASALSARAELPLELPWPSLYRVADHFFLDLLRREPARIEALLAELFERAPADDVLAFLDDRATPRQQARVALAMPRWLRWAVAEAPLAGAAPA